MRLCRKTRVASRVTTKVGGAVRVGSRRMGFGRGRPLKQSLEEFGWRRVGNDTIGVEIGG